MLAVALSGKFLSSLFFFLAMMFYKTCDENSNSTRIDKTKPNGSTNHNNNKNSGDKRLKDDPQGDKSIETSLNKHGNGDVKQNGNGLNQNGQNESTDF